MPGSSLWLVPREDSDFYKAVHSLILTSVPSVYPIAIPPRFKPHITLTADTVSSDLPNPQQWLENLKLSDLDFLKVTIQKAQVGSMFFQKLTLRCEKTPELCQLAAQCRAAALQQSDAAEAEPWIEENYRPHVSLMYSDLPEDEVRSGLDEVNAKIKEVKQAHSNCTTAQGASIWLVPTKKDIDAWQPIATRELTDVEWSWEG